MLAGKAAGGHPPKVVGAAARSDRWCHGPIGAAVALVLGGWPPAAAARSLLDHSATDLLKRSGGRDRQRRWVRRSSGGRDGQRSWSWSGILSGLCRCSGVAGVGPLGRRARRRTLAESGVRVRSGVRMHGAQEESAAQAGSATRAAGSQADGRPKSAGAPLSAYPRPVVSCTGAKPAV